MPETSCQPNPIDQRGWLSTARWVRSANFDARPPNTAPELIVIHSISLPIGCYGNGLIDRFFANQLDCSLDPGLQDIASVRVSAHFLVSRWGRITQFVSCADRAWHAGVSRYQGRGDCNNYSVGIELEGRAGHCYSTAQYQSLAGLCAHLIERFPTLNAQSIVGHEHIAPGRKDDPGTGFDWAELLNALASNRNGRDSQDLRAGSLAR